MSAGFHYSPLVRCPACKARIHPGLIGDIAAHAEAAGESVRFACAECGAALSWEPRVRRLPVRKVAGA